ncbi:hypothetical protein QBC45DRAFT_335861, partial [Copromyces sp. CBS 386.78]
NRKVALWVLFVRLPLQAELLGQTFAICEARNTWHPPIKVKLLKSPTDAQSNHSIPLVNRASRSDARESRRE